MEPSSLPKFPQATPPPAAPPTTGRGRTMLLQLLFLIAVGGGVYVLREQALAIKKALEKAAIEGKWQSTRAPEITLSLSGKYFRLSRDEKVFLSGEYSR